MPNFTVLANGNRLGMLGQALRAGQHGLSGKEKARVDQLISDTPIAPGEKIDYFLKVFHSDVLLAQKYLNKTAP